MGKGNPRLYIRLPENHWIWEIGDNNERNEEIRRALDFYRNFYKDITQIKNLLKKIDDIERDIKDIKKKGITVKDNEEQEEQNENKNKLDPRLLKSMNNFLDF